MTGADIVVLIMLSVLQICVCASRAHSIHTCPFLNFFLDPRRSGAQPHNLDANVDYKWYFSASNALQLEAEKIYEKYQ